MLGKKVTNGDLGHGDDVLIDSDEFGGEERPGVKDAGWAGVMRVLSASTLREKHVSTDSHESVRHPSSSSFISFHLSNTLIGAPRGHIGALRC